MRPIVHLLDTDGTLACSGVLLEDAASETDPPRVTIRSADVTCPSCLRRQRERPS